MSGFVVVGFLGLVLVVGGGREVNEVAGVVVAPQVVLPGVVEASTFGDLGVGVRVGLSTCFGPGLASWFLSVVATSGAGKETIEEFVRGLPAECLAGSAVEFVGHFGEAAGVVLGEVGALGEVVAEETVGVLVRAALPW